MQLFSTTQTTIPAKAGIHLSTFELLQKWVPAFAGSILGVVR
jgi:hypothetical protein